MRATRDICDALRLRQWALGALVANVSPNPQCSAGAWQLFLGTERCALRLQTRLREIGQYRQLDSTAQHELSTAARRELQRVLCARAQLELIGRLAQENGWRVAVLKGGIHALSDRDAIDLADLDVLTSKEQAPRLAHALDRAGYSGSGGSSDQHLKARVAHGELAIDIHTVADAKDVVWSAAAWERATATAVEDGLLTLSAGDHLWHVLSHVVVRHPYRRSALRDLMLIRDALEGCSEEEIGEIESKINQHRYARALRKVLAAARRLSSASAVADDFAWHAAAVYYVRSQGVRLPLTRVVKGDTGRWVLALLCGPAEVGFMVRLVWVECIDHSLSPQIAAIERRAPRLGRLVRVGARILRYSAALAFAIPLAAMAALVAWATVRQAATQSTASTAR